MRSILFGVNVVKSRWVSILQSVRMWPWMCINFKSITRGKTLQRDDISKSVHFDVLSAPVALVASPIAWKSYSLILLSSKKLATGPSVTQLTPRTQSFAAQSSSSASWSAMLKYRNSYTFLSLLEAITRSQSLTLCFFKYFFVKYFKYLYIPQARQSGIRGMSHQSSDM